MKKILLGLAALILIIGGGFTWYNTNYGGHTYYIQIHGDGEVKELTSNGGTPLKRYNYKIMGYDSDGKEKEVEFMSHHNLKHEAYLEVLYNKKKGVMSWEERQRNEVPKEALKHLE
ncbi:YxeA family protein [Lactococcus garvieae]|uniref:YxeA family protein n=1 Tax=Lactococcus garvieae TaxID=1363 RepID=UPI003851C448